MANYDDNGGSLAWFLAGCAIGAAGALLLAPQSGSSTREQLRRRAEEGRLRMDEARREAYERGRRAYEEGRRRAEEAAESGRRAVDRGRELYERGKTAAEDAASSLTSGGSESGGSQEPPAPLHG